MKAKKCLSGFGFFAFIIVFYLFITPVVFGETIYVPGDYATIRIYAKLTKNLTGIRGATAIATVHFQTGDVQLDQQESDNGGYVTFSLPLQGRQPSRVPATVDVTFTNSPGGTLKCTPAFFTPT